MLHVVLHEAGLPFAAGRTEEDGQFLVLTPRFNGSAECRQAELG
jgi:hypothetical protein